MVSTEMHNLITFLQHTVDKGREPHVAAMRNGLEQLAAMAPPYEGVFLSGVDAGGVPAEWVAVPGSDGKGVILYFHGGGYTAGSLSSHRNLVSRLAVEAGRLLLAVDYRLAPEHPFPAAVDDAVAAYRWLVNSEGVPAGMVIIGGDSAGGGLALAALIKLREEGDRLPRAAFCLSPWTDLAMTGDSIRTKADEDPFVEPRALGFLAGQYLQGTDPEHPLASPLYADLTGLPPLLIQVGERECLLDDSLRLAEKAKAAGVDVTIDVWPEMIHVFQSFAPVAPEGVAGIRRVAEYLNALD
ncbi:MAG: alpha/beta hydrolase [Thermodesulfobacteriota bacterium]